MCCHPEFARICSLINDSLSSFAEPELLHPLTKEKEKNLLIILSQISREIRGLEDDRDSDSDDQEKLPHGDDFHDCIASIVCLLVILLNVESQFVRHSTSNVLVGISNFLVKSGSKLDGYLDLLCLCLEVSISNILSPTSAFLRTGTTESDRTCSRFIPYVKKKMVNTNWFTVAGLVRVLRTILKHLKQCPDGELTENYMDSVSYCLTNIAWESLDETHVIQDSESKISSSKDLSKKFGSPVSRFVFLGTLLQLFCSIVHKSSSMEADTSNEHPVLGKISSLVPKLLYWCFHNHEDGNWTSSSQYLKHKMLMLMIRLSFGVHQEFSMLVLWLQLLHTYFQDLLHQAISKSHGDLDDCLEGSPFLSSIADGQKFHRLCICHLQRQAIFLFLKCSLGLINLGKETDTKCSCATSVSCLIYDLQSGQECCTWKKGLLELSEWLDRHVPLDLYVDYELYLGKCGGFASSLLQLFIDELHYDHSVLLDYLISKDAGVHCLQYLLRCLRAISNSWNLFLEFPVCGAETVWSSWKKRKLSPCGSDFNSDGEVEPTSSTGKGRSYLGMLDSKSKTNSNFGSILNDTRKKTFQNAKDCLFSLKNSVESLHQKNLFPYNPAALLRSFTRFQELCHQQESVYLQKTGRLTL